jgi:hypothetical protein
MWAAMNSSISSSEISENSLWRRWIIGFAITFFCAIIFLLSVITVIDPFSSGRLTPITRVDFVGDRHYADVARIRDLSFEGATFGNSHVMRVDPENLSRMTGLRFASLALESSGPQEQIFMMRLFERRRHDHPVTLVAGLDELTCAAEKPADPWTGTLPRWLYDGSDFTYLSHLLSPYGMRMAWRRLSIMSGWSEGERADGYTFERSVRVNAERLSELFDRAHPVEAPATDAPFPWLDELETAVRNFNPDDTVLLVFMPVYWNELPLPGSAAAARWAACKTRADAITHLLRRGAMLDLRVDGAAIRDRDNFYDPTHYKDSITRDIEAATAEKINSLLSTTSPR